MSPGLVIQHTKLPTRRSELVRCDIAGIIGFIPEDRWPEGAEPGDFIELYLRRIHDLWEHPDRALFDAPSQRAVRGFFENGGDTAHLFGVCLRPEDDLRAPGAMYGVLTPLLDRLRSEEDIGLLLSPSAAYMRCDVPREGPVHADSELFYDALLGHCREMHNRFLVMDTPQGLHGEPLERWVRHYRARQVENRSFGAIYYPWLMAGDECFPPSGAVAGSFARVEIEHGDFGVVWPPANVALRGVTHPEVELNWAEAGQYAERSINPLVVQAGRGVIVFGARTLSNEVRYQFINTRRIVSMIVEQLRRDTAWAVFETNNPHLWDVLDRDVRYRLEQFSSAGALRSESKEEDYRVLCDSSVNTPASLDAGQVNVEVTLRPVGTTERVLIDLCIGGEG
jgi:hypothetical protein